MDCYEESHFGDFSADSQFLPSILESDLSSLGSGHKSEKSAGVYGIDELRVGRQTWLG